MASRIFSVRSMKSDPPQLNSTASHFEERGVADTPCSADALVNRSACPSARSSTASPSPPARGHHQTTSTTLPGAGVQKPSAAHMPASRDAGYASAVAQDATSNAPQQYQNDLEGAKARKNTRARTALYCQCSGVGVQVDAELVQPEVACFRQWKAQGRELYLHRDCLLDMVKNYVSSVVLMPPKFHDYFPECGAHEIPVAIRVPKDDTAVKKEKESKGPKELSYPKYNHHRGLANWNIDRAMVVEIDGVCLGWKLCGNQYRPVGCEPANDGLGLPEPLRMLAVRDLAIREDSNEDQPEFLKCTIRERRNLFWTLVPVTLRTVFEIFSIYIFMSYIGSRPNSYRQRPFQPWDTESNGDFDWPGLFTRPEKWRSPGMERIWELYLVTFLLFAGFRLVIAAVWAVLPARGGFYKFIRHALAALYPLTVTIPFILYLLYYFAALVNCRTCTVWGCGVYSEGTTLKLNTSAFVAAGGCKIDSEEHLYEFQQFVELTPVHRPENVNCEKMHNFVLDQFGLSLDTSVRQGTCEARWETVEAKRNALLYELDEACGDGSVQRLRPREVSLSWENQQKLPWHMFAWNLPRNLGNCTPQDKWSGPYVYYEHALIGAGDPMDAICVCRSQSGTRDCFKNVEGTVNRCLHFTGQPSVYGGMLQYDHLPDFEARLLPLFIYIVIPVYGLFTVLAWSDLPLGGQDKTDLRLVSRMKLDILDAFMFYFAFIRRGEIERQLPVIKYFLPDMAWHDFELYVWLIACGSVYFWMSLVVFMHILDEDPDKTPKTWKSVAEILQLAEDDVGALVKDPQISNPYATAVRKQAVLYEKEVQKFIKKRTVVDILDDDADPEEAYWKDWHRCVIVFSSPKLKDMTAPDFEVEGEVFTLHVIGGWPWSAHPSPDVWKAESWKEYVNNCDLGPDVTPEEVGLRTVSLTYDEALTRVRPQSAYFWLDPRYLGWCWRCGRQPKHEFKKMKEDDFRVEERIKGYSETYWNKYQFDWWERNVEFFSGLRSLLIDSLFFFSRLITGIWIGGFDDWLSALLMLKNLMFIMLGITYIFACGNSKGRSGFWAYSSVELLARCIENTQIGSAIKLGMLMPLRIVVECLTCGCRMVAESRQDYCTKRMHMLILRHSRLPADVDADELDHEIRLLAIMSEDLTDLISRLDTKQLVRMKAKMKAKDIIG